MENVLRVLDEMIDSDRFVDSAAITPHSFGEVCPTPYRSTGQTLESRTYD